MKGSIKRHSSITPKLWAIMYLCEIWWHLSLYEKHLSNKNIGLDNVTKCPQILLYSIFLFIPREGKSKTHQGQKFNAYVREISSQYFRKKRKQLIFEVWMYLTYWSLHLPTNSNSREKMHCTHQLLKEKAWVIMTCSLWYPSPLPILLLIWKWLIGSRVGLYPTQDSCHLAINLC